MKCYLLDSNALSDCIFRRRGVDIRVANRHKHGDRVGTATPIVAEILAGTETSASRDRNRPIVNRNLKHFRIWPFDLAAAREYARLYAEMKRKGDRVEAIDLMIAAIAMTLRNGVVVTSDRDFERVPGLAVENWAS